MQLDRLELHRGREDLAGAIEVSVVRVPLPGVRIDDEERAQRLIGGHRAAP
jgi:hypothetical protein